MVILGIGIVTHNRGEGKLEGPDFRGVGMACEMDRYSEAFHDHGLSLCRVVGVGNGNKGDTLFLLLIC